jgi:hypothetical protein
MSLIAELLPVPQFHINWIDAIISPTPGRRDPTCPMFCRCAVFGAIHPIKLQLFRRQCRPWIRVLDFGSGLNEAYGNRSFDVATQACAHVAWLNVCVAKSTFGFDSIFLHPEMCCCPFAQAAEKCFISGGPQSGPPGKTGDSSTLRLRLRITIIRSLPS